MISNDYTKILESATFKVLNPFVKDFNKPLNESAVADIKLTDLRAVYPLIRALNSGKLTRNFTFYPAETLRGKKDKGDPTGYCSFVWPYGKPVLREHRLQASGGLFEPNQEADIPMGRILWSAYKKRAKTETQTPHKKAYMPGTVEGDGYMAFVGSITEEEAINRILGRQYHTVSVGSTVEKVVESISGIDLIAAYKSGQEMPKFERGTVYTIDGKEQLCYWSLYGQKGDEISFVNDPADVLAATIETDIGFDAVKLLLGEKTTGSNEFKFYDPVSKEHVILTEFEEFAVDESLHFVDSVRLARDTWVIPVDIKEKTKRLVRESVGSIEPAVGDFIQFTLSSETINGVITGIYTEGKVPAASNDVDGSDINPGLSVRVYQHKEGTWKPTKRVVACTQNDLIVPSAQYEAAIEQVLSEVQKDIAEHLESKEQSDPVKAIISEVLNA